MKRIRMIAFLLSLSVFVSLFSAPCAEAAKKKAKKPKVVTGTLDTIKDEYAIESDIVVRGHGDGYHVKLVLLAPDGHEHGVSFGLQYDVDALPPYDHKLALLFENIYSNKHEPGEQVYHRPLNVKLKPGKKYHLMLTMNREAMSMKTALFQGAGKHNGDRVRADFTNIRVKDDMVDTVEAFLAYPINTASKIKSEIHSNSHVTLSGVLTGLKPGEDWDSAYDRVSGIVRYTFE